MPEVDILEPVRANGFQFEFHAYARAILLTVLAGPMQELVHVLQGVTVPIEEILASGGGRSQGDPKIAQGADEEGWRIISVTFLK
jgi:hypothetical protein